MPPDIPDDVRRRVWWDNVFPDNSVLVKTPGGWDITSMSEGAFYRVDIPDNLIDYDKPLREQPPDMKQALESAWVQNRVAGGMPREAALKHASGAAQEMKASDILRLMEAKGPADVSAQLLSAGIPGHRYRGDSSGVENYVVYDDKQIKPMGRWASLAEFLSKTKE